MLAVTSISFTTSENAIGLRNLHYHFNTEPKVYRTSQWFSDVAD